MPDTNWTSRWFDDRNDRHSDRSFLSSGFLVGIFALMAAWLTYDEVRFPGSVPLASTDVATVPLLNVWTIGWNADRLAHGFRGYWDAPIFAPVDSAFAFSEPQPATILVAPIVWVTGSSVVGYKAWLFFSLMLNGVVSALLLRRLRYSAFLQLAGGVAVTLTPLVHQRIDVVQLVPIWGILWFWSSVFALAERPAVVTAVLTGFAFGMCFALCVHHGLFLLLLTFFSVPVFLPCLTNIRFLVATLASVMLATAMILPIVVPIRAAAKAHSFLRRPDQVQQLSARPIHYLVSPPSSLSSIRQFAGPESRQFCPGWLRMMLAVLGIGYGLFRGIRRRWTLFLLLTGTVAFVFSLGLHVDLFGWKPWQTLSDNVPGFDQVRSVFRFAWFVQLTMILLGVEGLTALHAFYTGLGAIRWKKTALTCCFIVPAALYSVEVRPETPDRAPVPDAQIHSGWTRFIRESAVPGRSLACLPFATGLTIQDYELTAQWMYHGLSHKVPMVNGYSGFFPRDHLHLQELVTTEFPSVRVLEVLEDFDVQQLVVKREYCPPNVMLGLSTDSLDVKLVFTDPVGMDVYRLNRRP